MTLLLVEDEASFLAGNVRASTRSEQVKIDIPNPTEELKPGMFASARLPISRPQSSLFIPKTAVVTTAERTYVIRVAGGRTEPVDVQIGDEIAAGCRFLAS